MRSVVTEVIDTLNSELDERFQQADTALWKAFEHLNPASDSFLDAGELAPLLRYALQIPAIRQKLPANVSQEQLNAECTVFRTMISDERDRLHRVGRECKRKEKKNTMNGLTKYVMGLGGATILKQLYLVASTAGYSSSVVECCFSALNRIDTCHRRTMTPYREAELTLLHFENDLTRKISFEDFKKLWLSKPRLLSIPN